MIVPSPIFREYDIRGVAETELTDELSRAIGRAFATALVRDGKKKIAVGHDLRKSSDRIFRAFVSGLAASGLDVIELGLCPTPVVYFSVNHLKIDGSVSITGSHNPSEYNGFKLHLADRPFYGREIQQLRERIERSDFAEGRGRTEKAEVIPAYKKVVQNIFKFRKKIKVVVDSGHGMGGLVAPDLFRALGCDVTELYSNLDSDFPDHHPDPSVPSNLVDLQRKVTQVKADLGIAFDGDADRIGVVDEKGNVIYGDKILLLYARALLKRKPGATIIGDVKCSQAVYDDIKKYGGKPLMWKTGHSLIKAKMKETGAELAGEMSGHMFFVDRWFGFDDAIYAACRMLEIVDESKDPVSELLSDLPPLVSTPEIRIDCPDQVKFDLVERIAEDFKKQYQVITIDGVRVVFPDGWGLVRASNTQPVLVLRFEATSEKRLNEIRKLIENKIQNISHSAGSGGRKAN